MKLISVLLADTVPLTEQGEEIALIVFLFDNFGLTMVSVRLRVRPRLSVLPLIEGQADFKFGVIHNINTPSL